MWLTPCSMCNRLVERVYLQTETPVVCSKCATSQPEYTDCPNCGTCDHRDYACPCGQCPTHAERQAHSRNYFSQAEAK
jgi:hypothetical protein